MGCKTVAWNQKVSSWGLTTQAWTSSQAEWCLLVRKEGRRGSKEEDKWKKLQNPNIAILWGQNLLLHWILQLHPTPHNPKAVFSVENHVVDGWSCRGIIRETERRWCLLLLLLFCQRGLVGKHKVEVGYLWSLFLMRKRHAVSGS